MIYQYSWNIISDTTRGSCMLGAPLSFLHIVRQHLNQTFGEQWTGRGGPVNGTQKTSQFLAVGAPKSFGVLSVDK
jgi:hypothetical protein